MAVNGGPSYLKLQRLLSAPGEFSRQIVAGSSTTSGTLFRDYDSYALGSTVPVQDMRNPSLVSTTFQPGLYLSDVSSAVPSPAAAGGGLVLLGGMALKRRRV